MKAAGCSGFGYVESVAERAGRAIVQRSRACTIGRRFARPLVGAVVSPVRVVRGGDGVVVVSVAGVTAVVGSGATVVIIAVDGAGAVAGANATPLMPNATAMAEATSVFFIKPPTVE
ncbi:hypothetical protein [Acidovorax sp. 16-64-162]|uniref:hypothetical protein n=1 Tax=Acidovorax sp. 16-64-162 TaxID=1970307 RepID=UPI0025BF2994|nr:hypothetical protein [Acidovorax sp. 16-64-162]